MREAKGLVLVSAILPLTLAPASAAVKHSSSAKMHAPGQLQKTPGQAKKFAPGQRQRSPGQAREFAPGEQRTTTGQGSSGWWGGR